jgi:hypothetical protein
MLNENRVFLIPMVAALCFVSIVLAGCSSPVLHKSLKTKVDIPAETFECDVPTNRPSGERIMESDVAKYINSIEFAHKDCRTRLKEVQVLLKCANEPKCDPKLLVELLAVAKPEKSR